jgi:UV excision repair protein RAD23
LSFVIFVIMKLTVKTLKGAKFVVDVDDSNTVEQVKAAIVRLNLEYVAFAFASVFRLINGVSLGSQQRLRCGILLLFVSLVKESHQGAHRDHCPSPSFQLQEKTKSELPAAGMKLIHSGKVLKDADAISKCGIQPNDFLVVMVTKPKKPVAATAAAPAAAPAAAAAAATPAKEEATSPSAAAAGTSTGTDAAAPAAAMASTPAPGAGAAAAAAATSAATAAPGAPARPASAEPEVSAEAVESLTSMGFPEAEVRHCLRAAGNNPDVAIEFLTNGIPDAVTSALERAAAGGGGAAAAAAASPSASGAAAGQQPPLQSLRNHPQFDNLRRLVQSNPAMLQQVLTQIGQQQPELLAEINSHQGLFLEMMNEPVAPAPEGAAAASSSGAAGSAPARGGSAPLGGAGFGSPGQMASLISSMGNDELQQMASMMGISVDQLRQTANLIGSMPEAELNQFMMQAMGGGGYGGDDDDDDIMGGSGGAGAGGGGFGGPQVVRLTEEEMAAVDRLTEMGFDRSDAAQAFLACDKNEAMAANLLMDSMGDGGGFFGGGGGPGDNNDGDNNDNNNNGQGNMDDDADDMYD